MIKIFLIKEGERFLNSQTLNDKNELFTLTKLIIFYSSVSLQGNILLWKTDNSGMFTNKKQLMKTVEL